MTKRAAYYARVSTDMRVDNTSLPEQREVCEAAIKVRGWGMGGLEAAVRLEA